MKKRMSITAGLLLFISMSITSFANEKVDDFSSDTTLTQIESENYAEKLVSENDDLLQETIANLKKGYSEYYDILNTETTLCSSHEINGNMENLYLLEMDVILKANSVEEMDYYQGVTDYYETELANFGQLRNVDSIQHMNALYSERSTIYDDLSEYIGKEQKISFYVRETYSLENETEKTVLFENGMEYVSWEAMLPASHEDIQENGYASMAYMDTEYNIIAEKATVQQLKASYSYSVSDAVSYMIRYTSNPTTCNACGLSSCKSKADTTKYNSNYANYAYNHSDCANYVSQALCEGGIPTDSTWKAGSGAWIGVSNLTLYMTSNGYWTSVTYNVLQKGDIVKFSNISHVVMITSFDGVSYGYSGHTSDRRNCVMTFSNSTGKYYRVG